MWPLALTLIVTVPSLTVGSIIHAMIWNHYRRKHAEIKAKNGNGLSEEAKAEFAAIRAEIHTLRDTTLQYDLSFDTSLQQMERRLISIETQKRYGVEEPIREQVRPGNY